VEIKKKRVCRAFKIYLDLLVAAKLKRVILLRLSCDRTAADDVEIEPVSQ
jgi:hypothetical protein